MTTDRWPSPGLSGLVCRLTMLAALHAVACSLPVHITQSPHILVYTQRFTFCPNQRNLRDALVRNLFGLEPEYAPRAEDLENAIVRGSAYVRVASLPNDPEFFTIAGHGWHRMYYKATANKGPSRYVAAADNKIGDDIPVPVSDLRRGFLVITVEVETRSYFAQHQKLPNRPLHATYGEGTVFLKVFLRKLADDVFAIDADREHLIGVLLTPVDRQKAIQTIGYMTFNDSGDDRDLWDLRRRWLVASDDPTISAETTDRLHPGVHASSLEWLPADSCPAGPVEIARGNGDVR